MPKFDEAVIEEIKSLDVTRCEAALAQGDLIERLVPTGGSKARNGGMEALLALSLVTGIALNSLRHRRYVSGRVPHALRGACATWSAYHEVARVGDDLEREALLARMLEPNPDTASHRWTVDAVREALDRAPRDHSRRKTQPGEAEGLDSLEARLEAYKRLQGDKEVMDAIARALLGAGKETPEQKLARERDEALQEASDFKASHKAMEQSLAEMKKRLEALEGAEQPTGVQTDRTPEKDARGEIVAGQEARVKAALEADVAFKYREYASNLENFTGRNAPAAVATALLASNIPVHPDTYRTQATKLGAWLDALDTALGTTPRLRVVAPTEGAR